MLSSLGIFSFNCSILYHAFSALLKLLLSEIFLIAFTSALFSFQGTFFGNTSSFFRIKLPFRRLSSALVGTNGLEPSTSRLSGVRSNHLSYAPFLFCGWLSVFFSCFTFGGDEEDRTPDPLLAGQVLSQLSYTPSGLAFSVFLLLSYSLFKISAFTETFKIEQCFL